MRIRTSEEPVWFSATFARGAIRFVYDIGTGLPGFYCPEGGDQVSVGLIPWDYMSTPVNRGMVNVHELHQKQFMKCVKDWKGLEDDQGESLECSPDNKRLVFNTNKVVREFVLECLDELAGGGDTLLKNS